LEIYCREQTNEPAWTTRKKRIDTSLAALPQPWTIIWYNPFEDADNLPEPQELIEGADEKLDAAVDELKDILEETGKEAV